MNRNIEDLPCWLEDDTGSVIEPVSEQEVFWDNNPTTLYYICSRVQQVFSVVVDCKTYLNRICTPNYPNVHALLFIDGREVSALVTDISMNETMLEFKGLHAGDSYIRPFRFENLVSRWLQWSCCCPDSSFCRVCPRAAGIRATRSSATSGPSRFSCAGSD